jgi:DUF971 family protein
VQPSALKYHRRSAELEIVFGAGRGYRLSAEYLRVHSPSAEVRGHHPDEAVLQVGKQDVRIREMELLGHYAVRLRFDDGHDSGIYSWDYLEDLAVNHDAYWQAYLAALEREGGQRRSNIIARSGAAVWEPKREA